MANGNNPLNWKSRKGDEMTYRCHPQYHYWKHWKRGPTKVQDRAHDPENLWDNTVFLYSWLWQVWLTHWQFFTHTKNLGLITFKNSFTDNNQIIKKRNKKIHSSIIHIIKCLSGHWAELASKWGCYSQGFF